MSDKSIASFVKTHKPYGKPGFLHWERFAEAKFSNYDECNENEQNGSMTWGRENKIVLTLSNDMQWVIVDADGEKYTFDAETKTNECIRHLRWMMEPEWAVKQEIKRIIANKGYDAKEAEIEMYVMECAPPIFGVDITVKGNKTVFHNRSWSGMLTEIDEEFK